MYFGWLLFPLRPNGNAHKFIFSDISNISRQAGEIVIFDRSWYNRAGVERVMGFCTDEQYDRFLKICPAWEKDIISAGVTLIKYWFEVSKDEQTRRFAGRINDLRKIWKLSPMDLESHRRWYDYSRARDAMFAATDTKESPWLVVKGDDKRRARLNCIAHFLGLIPYEEIHPAKVNLLPDRKRRGTRSRTIHITSSRKSIKGDRGTDSFFTRPDEAWSLRDFALGFTATLRPEPRTDAAKQCDRAVEQRSQESVVPNVPGSPPLELGVQ